MSSNQQRTVLRKPASARAQPAAQTPDSTVVLEEQQEAHPVPSSCLLDASTWQMHSENVASMLTSASDFSVVGALGRQGLGKSEFLNRLLGLRGQLAAAGPHPSPAFPVWRGSNLQPWQHCTRGMLLGVSSDRLVGLDTQPLLSLSVLEDMSAEWATPPSALAAPAVAAASEGKASAVPYEGVQVLAQLQLAVLLLSGCQRLLVFCEGWRDEQTWELLQTAEMLARSIADPSLVPQGARDAAPASATGAGTTAAPAQQPAGGSTTKPASKPQAAAQRQQGPAVQEHLAEVVLVHVVPAGSGPPAAAELHLLQHSIDAYFAGSRLQRSGALRMLDHVGSHGVAATSSQPSGQQPEERMSYWVLEQLQGASSGPDEAAGWAELVGALLARPCPPFAKSGCSEQQWLHGLTGPCWRAVCKSTDIATFYSRLARTRLKGAGGWGLAR